MTPTQPRQRDVGLERTGIARQTRVADRIRHPRSEMGQGHAPRYRHRQHDRPKRIREPQAPLSVDGESPLPGDFRSDRPNQPRLRSRFHHAQKVDCQMHIRRGLPAQPVRLAQCQTCTLPR